MSTSSGSSEPCRASLAAVEEAPEVGPSGGLEGCSVESILVSLDESVDEDCDRLQVSSNGLTGLGRTAAE